MTSAFDMDKFNGLLNLATNVLSCDDACMAEKERDKLQQQYMKAKMNLIEAPQKYETAERNYYLHSEGEEKYNERMEQKHKKTAQLLSDKINDRFERQFTELNENIIGYNAVYVNYNNIRDLYLKYKRENVMLKKKLKIDTNDVLTNERKTYYEDQQIDNLKYYYYILYILYIIGLVLFILFSITRQSTLSNMNKIAYIAILIILPYISTWLLSLLMRIGYIVYSMLPKNVYLSN
jgi:hypothetical protein